MASGLNTIINTNYPASLSRMEFYATDQNGNIVRYDSRSAILRTHLQEFPTSGADISVTTRLKTRWTSGRRRTAGGGHVRTPPSCRRTSSSTPMTNSDRFDLFFLKAHKLAPCTCTVSIHPAESAWHKRSPECAPHGRMWCVA